MLNKQTFINAVKTQIAKAKLLYNKDKETYKIIVAFNVTQKTKNGNYVFPTQKQCNFVSGDFVYETLQQDSARIIEEAKQVLRTDKIVFVK